MNNQIVVGTLMNICDNPNKVSLGEGWNEKERTRRTPIIVTGTCSCDGVGHRPGLLKQLLYKRLVTS